MAARPAPPTLTAAAAPVYTGLFAEEKETDGLDEKFYTVACLLQWLVADHVALVSL